MSQSRITTSFSFFLIFFCCLISVASARKPDQKITVFTAISPYAFFLDQIGGGFVDVETLVGPGKDPHTFEPTPGQISRLGSAVAYFKVGMPFEDKLVEKMASVFPNLKIINSNKGINFRKMEPFNHQRSLDHGKRSKQSEHDHPIASGKGPDSSLSRADHDHGAMDPHVWLSPSNVKIICSNMTEALVSMVPEKADVFRSNAQTFYEKIDALGVHLKESLNPLKGKTFYVYHPAYGYLADEYGLRQVAVEIEGKEPSAKQLARLVDSARKEGVKVIFVAPQFSRKGAETVAAGIGGVVVDIDPLSKDYLNNMYKMGDKISSGLK